MRTIGMLGGMSWESTDEYYRLANELVRSRLGGVHSARLLVDSLDFAGVEVLQSTDRWDEASVATVGLVGTAFTMEHPFYRERLERHGLEVLVPGANDRATVHRVIYDELVRGVVDPVSRDAYRRVIGRLVDAGAEGVVLGCTEIELLVSADDSPVPVFPTTRIHVEAAVRLATD